MNIYEIIQKIGDMYQIGNTESWEFSYVQELKTVWKNIKDYQKGDTVTNHQYLDIRFENDRLVILVEIKNKIKMEWFLQ